MIYHSPSPFEIGAFGVDEATKVALDIGNGNYEISRTEFSGRLVVECPQIESIILESIGLYNAVDDANDGLLRNRVYAQDFSEIHPPSFSGLPWRIDYDEKPFAFNFGSNAHPTEYVSGYVDLTEAYAFAAALFERKFKPETVLFWARKQVGEVIERA